MKRLGPWSLTPPGSALAADGQTLLVPTADGYNKMALPAPLYREELQVWAKVPANVAFPLNRAAALVLFDHASELLEGIGIPAQLDAAGAECLSAECWRVVCGVFRPGVGVRSCVDRFIEEGGVRPKLTQIEDEAQRVLATQLAHVAAWAVLRAAADMCEDAS